MNTKKNRAKNKKRTARGDVANARAEWVQHSAEAAVLFDQYPSQHRFAMVGQCDDKNGNPVEVLIINTDPEGFLGLILDIGNPYSFGTGKIKEDPAKLRAWLSAMSNIDLNNADVQRAAGTRAMLKAREAVSNFFMLLLVSSPENLLPPENGALSTTRPQAGA